MTMHLTEQFHLPEQYHSLCDRLTALIERHTQRVLKQRYWEDRHLIALTSHTGPSYTYIRDDDWDGFADTDEYLYSRFKRCIHHRVASVLEAHADEEQAFRFVTETLSHQKNQICRVGETA